jgi:aspartyl/asparaginyl beta-hydroxylase (cupin superfamily)
MFLKTISIVLVATATTTVVAGWQPLVATRIRTASSSSRKNDDAFLKTCNRRARTNSHSSSRNGVMMRNSMRLASSLCANTVSTTTTDESSSSSSSFSPDTTVAPPPHVLSTPLPLHTFAGQVEQGMKERFGEENVQRILQSWRLLEHGYEHKAFVGNDLLASGANSSDGHDETKRGIEKRRRDPETSLCHQHAVSYVPGLSVREFWNATDFDWCRRLARSYPAIRKELDKVMSAPLEALQQRGNNVWAGALTQDAGSYGVGWKTLVLMDRGRWDATNVQNLFPVTAQAVRDAQAPAVEVFFASMQPASKIMPHSDFTNFVLTCHLALDIPQSGNNICRIRVGDETRQWENGKVLLFDTSLLHDAVNDSVDETRYILMLRVWHPDLTEMERQALQFTYDCLEEPNLVVPTATAEERYIAQERVQALRVFPTIASSSLRKTTTKAAVGFGSSNSAKGGVKSSNNNNKKQRKAGGKR